MRICELTGKQVVPVTVLKVLKALGWPLLQRGAEMREANVEPAVEQAASSDAVLAATGKETIKCFRLSYPNS